MHSLAEQHGDRLVLCSLGVPSVLDLFPEVRYRVCAFSDVEVSQEALAGWLWHEMAVGSESDDAS